MFFDIGFRSYFISCFLLIPVSVHAAEISPGHVIIFDGMSNAGKTMLAKPLLNLLGSSYINITLDEYVTDLWLEKKGAYLPEQEFVGRVHSRVEAMYDDIRSLVLQGKSVLLDTVISGLAGENDSNRCFEKLKGIPIFMVLVYCPLPVVVERMNCRNEDAILHNKPGRMRPIIVSAKFGDIYRIARNGDVVIDRISKKDIEYAYEVPQELPDQEKNLYVQLRDDLVSKFELRDNDEVAITSCFQYDCVVNTNICTPEQCAQQICDCFMHWNMRAFTKH